MSGHIAQQRSPGPDNFRAVGLQEPCYARQTFFLHTNQLAHRIGHLGDRTVMSRDFPCWKDTTATMCRFRQTQPRYKIPICITPFPSVLPLTLSFTPLLHRSLQSQPPILCHTTGTPSGGLGGGDTLGCLTDIPSSWRNFTFHVHIALAQLPVVPQVIGCFGAETANDTFKKQAKGQKYTSRFLISCLFT